MNTSNEKPIIFNSNMVRAILEGRKTQTRRPLKANSRVGSTVEVCANILRKYSFIHDFSPYGKPGDYLWVREAFTPRYFDDNSPGYKANYTEKSREFVPEPKWKPAIHMPKEASRIILRITNVYIEKLQNIRCTDALNEGCPDLCGINPHVWFKNEWDAIYAKRGYSWDSDPWVWVIIFNVAKIMEGQTR